MPSAPVPETARIADDTRDPRQWGWVEPTVWSERMLAALVNGVTGGKWYSLWDKVSDRWTLEASWRAVALQACAGCGLNHPGWFRAAPSAHHTPPSTPFERAAGSFFGRPSPLAQCLLRCAGLFTMTEAHALARQSR